LAASVLPASSVSCIRDGWPSGPELGPGDRLPEFSVVMSDGSTMGTSELGGSVSVIVFFNTGCPDCREELPVLQKLYANYGNSIKMLCISREQGGAEIEEYWSANGLSLPYSAQEDRSVYNLFSRSGIPRVYVSSGDLVIRTVYDDDPVAGYDDLAGDVGVLLQDACL